MCAGALRSVQPARSRRRRSCHMDCRPSQPHTQTGEAMNRLLFFVLLLLTVAQAEQKPKAQRGEGTESQNKKEAAQESAKSAKVDTEKGDEGQEKPAEDPKLTSVPGSKALGMSILGNQDAPKSLVIVPWKSSELGESPGISPMLDDSRQPVDKEVFMRALRYYEIRSKTKQ